MAQIEYVEDDYRNISGCFDAFVSVGMLEHVGRGELSASWAALRARAGRQRPRADPLHRPQLPGAAASVDRAAHFPGRLSAGLGEMTQIFEPWICRCWMSRTCGCITRRTLRDWLTLFEAAVDRVRGMFDEKFVRMWRLYLAGSVAAFATGTLQLFQVLFATAQNNNIPLTRDHLYPR